MRLRELISFVRQIQQRPDFEEQRTRNEPFLDEPNAPRRERLPVPPWVRDDGGTQRIRDRGDLILDVEQAIAPTALPPDLQVPNPPIDTLAYYLPFHLYESDWGIYLRESGVLVAVSILKGSALARGDFTLLERGRRLLLDHELLHFYAEVACARAVISHELDPA